VNAVDFETITRRTPGVTSAASMCSGIQSRAGSNEPETAGPVTLMIVPKYDNVQPDAPLPDSNFLDAICKYVDSRRLVTTEVFLRDPSTNRSGFRSVLTSPPTKRRRSSRSVKQEMLRFSRRFQRPSH